MKTFPHFWEMPCTSQAWSCLIFSTTPWVKWYYTHPQMGKPRFRLRVTEGTQEPWASCVGCTTVDSGIFDVLIGRVLWLTNGQNPVIGNQFLQYSLHRLCTYLLFCRGVVPICTGFYGFQSTFTYMLLFWNSEKLYRVGRAGCDFFLFLFSLRCPRQCNS